MLRKDLPIRTNFAENAGGVSGSNILIGQTFLSPIRTNFLSPRGINIPEPFDYELWTPAEITTALWLDASSGSNFVLSGGDVSQWLDLSGGNNHAIQAIPSKQPDYSSDAVTFDGTDDYLQTGSISSLNTDIISWFIDCKFNATVNTQVLIRSAYSSGAASNSNQIWGSFVQSGIFYSHSRTGAGSFVGATGTATVADCIIEGVWDLSDTISFYLNGGNISSASGANASPSGHQLIRIGATSNFEAFFFAGIIREIIVVTGTISTETRQKVEGYLSHKRNRANNLPDSHPYRSTPPLIFN